MGNARWYVMSGGVVILMACGGGGGGGSTSQPPQPTKATGLVYTDPVSSDFRLMWDAASTGTKLILRLVGPTGTTGRGVAFTFMVDPALVDVVKVADADGEYVQNGDAFILGAVPRLLKGIKQNGTLRVTASQKGPGTARALDVTLVKLAVQFKSAAGLDVGAAIPISVTEGLYLPAAGGPVAMTVSPGSIKAQ